MNYANGQIVGLRTIAPVVLQPAGNAQYLAGPERIEAFTEVFYRGVSGSFFDEFASLDDFQLFLVRKIGASNPESTLGYGSRTGLCFFAAGLPPTASSTVQPAYEGAVDGISQTPSATLRLFQSPVTANFNAADGTGSIQLTLSGYPSAFSSPTGQSRVTIGTITANLNVSGTQVNATTVSGLSGYTGTMAGQLVGERAMALAFQLQAADGSVVWGAIALDNESCAGCWDY